MTKYHITHIDISSNYIEVTYDLQARLIGFDASQAPTFTLAQIDFLLRQIPRQLSDPATQWSALVHLGKGKLTITEAGFDVSFERFWNAYDYKRHKKDAEKLWAKLPYADQVTCLLSIKHYHAYRQRKGEWLQQMLPDTYINKREFETPWQIMR